MELIGSGVLWIFINTILPILPISISYLIIKFFSENHHNLKWYQFISKNDGLALYSSLISISSLSTPLLSFSSIPKQKSFIFLFMLLIVILVFSLVFYAILLYRSATIDNLYSTENSLNDNTEKNIAFIIVSLALAATVCSLIMNFFTGGL